MKTIFFFFISIASLVAQTVIPFDNPVPSAPVSCNDSWTESGIPQQLIPIAPATTCSFDYSSGDLWLFPAELTLDLSSLVNITSIEIDFVDYCGVGCTVAEFFENTVQVGSAMNATTSAPETITYINTSMDAIDAMTIQGLENQMMEIRIYTAPVIDPAEPDVWVDKGDVYLEDSDNGVVMTSPNGTCYRVKVDDNGGLITEEVTCP